MQNYGVSTLVSGQNKNKISLSRADKEHFLKISQQPSSFMT